MPSNFHWSRKLEQIAKDKEILANNGLSFRKVAGTFYTFMKPKHSEDEESPLKNRIVDLLIEKKYEGKTGPEYDAAEIIFKNWKGFWSG